MITLLNRAARRPYVSWYWKIEISKSENNYYYIAQRVGTGRVWYLVGEICQQQEQLLLEMTEIVLLEIEMFHIL